MRCVGQAGASCLLICALGIFIGAINPALCPTSSPARNRDAWCWVGAPGAHGFHHGKWPLAFRKCPFFPAAREGYSVRVLSPPPIRPKSRVTPVGRSTGTLYPIQKNRLLYELTFCSGRNCFTNLIGRSAGLLVPSFGRDWVTSIPSGFSLLEGGMGSSCPKKAVRR